MDVKGENPNQKTKVYPSNEILITGNQQAMFLNSVSREDVIQLNSIMKKYGMKVMVKQDIPL